MPCAPSDGGRSHRPTLRPATVRGAGRCVLEDGVEQRLRCTRAAGAAKICAHRRRSRRSARCCMTATRSQMSATTPKLWVTRIIAICRSPLQLPQQVEHLGLHRHVERGGRLVGDEQVGVCRDGAGDQHPLRHAAGDLVRVGREIRSGSGCRPFKQRERPFLASSCDSQVLAHRLGELGADRERRVEVRHRLLRDVADPAPRRRVSPSRMRRRAPCPRSRSSRR